MSDQYQAELDKKHSFKIRPWIESLLLLIAILGYCALQAYMEIHDQRVELAELAKNKHMTCQIRHNQDVHQFDCTVINDKLAVIP